MTERELAGLARQGDQDAFAQLVEKNQNRIYTLCTRMTGNPEDGADQAQEAFLRAWRSLPSFQGDSSFSTWLYRLARNLCIDFLRQKKRRSAAFSVVSLDGGEGEAPGDIPDRRPTPESEAERRELRLEVGEALSKLSDEHRQILVLRELEGLSYAEIADALGLEAGTVKSRIARARLAMRAFLLAGGNFSVPEPSTQTKGGGEG